MAASGLVSLRPVKTTRARPLTSTAWTSRSISALPGGVVDAAQHDGAAILLRNRDDVDGQEEALGHVVQQLPLPAIVEARPANATG